MTGPCRRHNGEGAGQAMRRPTANSITPETRRRASPPTKRESAAPATTAGSPVTHREPGDPSVEQADAQVLAARRRATRGASRGGATPTAIGAGTPSQREQRRGESRTTGTEDAEAHADPERRPATTSANSTTPIVRLGYPEVQDVVLCSLIGCYLWICGSSGCSSRSSTRAGSPGPPRPSSSRSRRCRRRSVSSRPSWAPSCSTGSAAAWSLTAAGEALVGPARQALRDVEAARAAVAGGRRPGVGPARSLCAARPSPSTRSPRSSASFRTAHPGVTVRLDDAEGPPEVLSSVASGDVELGITVETTTHGSELHSVALGRQELVAVLPPGARPPARAMTVVELARHPIVATPRGTSTRALLDDALRRAPASPSTSRWSPRSGRRSCRSSSRVPVRRSSPARSPTSPHRLGAVVVPMRPQVTRAVVAVHRDADRSPPLQRRLSRAPSSARSRNRQPGVAPRPGSRRSGPLRVTGRDPAGPLRPGSRRSPRRTPR